jgi:hypothetical protein
MKQKEVKPILIMKLGRSINQDDFNSISESFLKAPISKDYHIISFRGLDNDDTEFQVFCVKDFEEKKMEEIKQMIKKQLKQ